MAARKNGERILSIKEEQGSRFRVAPNCTSLEAAASLSIKGLFAQPPVTLRIVLKWRGQPQGHCCELQRGQATNFQSPTLGLKGEEKGCKRGRKKMGEIERVGSRAVCHRQGCGDLCKIDDAC